MQAKMRRGFKAVEFMRQVRNELSALFHTDKRRFKDELKDAMTEFLERRQNAHRQQGLGK
jgi:hypothetical protein